MSFSTHNPFAAPATAPQQQGAPPRRGLFVSGLLLVAGAVVVCVPIMGIAMFGYYFVQEQSYGTRVAFGEDEVYYAGEATEQDARRLGSVLQEMEYFSSLGVSVQISAEEGEYTISYVVQDGIWDDAEIIAAFEEFNTSIAEQNFPGLTTVALCDEVLRPQATISIEAATTSAAEESLAMQPADLSKET